VSAWGKEAGLELEDVKTLLRHENIATTSNVYGDLGMEAKRRIQQRLVEFVKKQAEIQETARLDAKGTFRSTPVNFSHPSPTYFLSLDPQQVQEKNGSSGRTRTYNPPVNSCTKRLPPIAENYYSL